MLRGLATLRKHCHDLTRRNTYHDNDAMADNLRASAENALHVDGLTGTDVSRCPACLCPVLGLCY